MLSDSRACALIVSAPLLQQFTPLTAEMHRLKHVIVCARKKLPVTHPWTHCWLMQKPR